MSKPLDYMCLGTRFGSGPSIAASSSYRVFWLSGGQAGQPNLQTGTFCAGNEVRAVFWLAMRFAHFLAWWAISSLRASSFTLEDNEDAVAPGDAKAETPAAVEVAAAPVKEVIRVLKALAKRVDVRNRSGVHRV